MTREQCLVTISAPAGVFDADNHFYESEDALLRHLPRQHRDAIRFVQVGGRMRIALQNLITDYIPNPTFELVAAPGKHVPYYAANNPEGRTLREMTGEPIAATPAMRSPAPRLEVMDQHGVERALVYPTLANLVEQRLTGPDLISDVIHALNEWMHEEWPFVYEGRIFSTPVIHLGLVDRAVAELEWVLARGAKAILIRPAPTEGYHGSRSVAMPEFDPFWARVQEADLTVIMHATDPVIAPYVDLWDKRTTDSAFRPNPFRAAALGHRDIEDALTSLICHGTLTRFPRLKVASIENGTEWIPYLFHRLDKVYRQMPQEFTEHPLDVFRRNIWVNPFWEEELPRLLEHVPVERVLFGSDWPHPEGLAEPLDYLDMLGDLDQPSVDRIMRDNANQLLGLQPA
jgi:predicted TIM-barrel fold metal-dependent hydrolase